MTESDKLQKEVEKQARRIRKAEHDRPTLIAQTVYLGTLGFLFIIPVVAGAYLGLWLDRQLKGYSVTWTLSLTLTGIVIGIINVYFFTRE